jgi:hypothetical protein
MESVVTLVVTENINCGQFFLFQRVPEFERHRLLLTESRCYIQWVIDRRTKPIFCVFPVYSVAVMDRGCDACRDAGVLFPIGFFDFKVCRSFMGIDCH